MSATATEATVPSIEPSSLQKRHAAKEAANASPTDGLDASAPASATDQLQKLVPAAAKAAVARLRYQSAVQRLQKYLLKLRAWVWYLVEELLEEFQPWLKWIVFDALLTLVVGRLVKHVGALRPLFEAIGWA